MKNTTYYNIDECNTLDVVIDKLDKLSDNHKIQYTKDKKIIKLKNLNLSKKEFEKLINFLIDNNILIDECDEDEEIEDEEDEEIDLDF